MPKRIVISSVIIGALLLMGTILTVSSLREPSYRGKHLRQWLMSYDNPGQAWECDEAVRAMGEQTLPFLMEMLKASDSRSKQAFVEMADDFGLNRFGYVPAERKHRWALAAYRSLGPVAKPAVPELIRALKTEEMRDDAQLALGSIGSASIAPLTEMLDEQNAGLRVLSANTLGECAFPSVIRRNEERTTEEIAAISVAGRKALPTLIRRLKDSDADVRAAVAAALGDFAVEPNQTIPALLDALNDSDPHVRRAAAVAIGRFRIEGTPALKPLIEKLEDPDAGVRDCAAFAIRLIDLNTAEEVGVR